MKPLCWSVSPEYVVVDVDTGAAIVADVSGDARVVAVSVTGGIVVDIVLVIMVPVIPVVTVGTVVLVS
ncbi:MAG: hypothetical protein NVSMB68_00730 [Thermoanaerobaculia bacterium]